MPRYFLLRVAVRLVNSLLSEHTLTSVRHRWPSLLSTESGCRLPVMLSTLSSIILGLFGQSVMSTAENNIAWVTNLRLLDFETLGTVAGWLNVAGLALQSFMLISNAFLPAARTRSHYLTQCLIIAVIWINVS